MKQKSKTQKHVSDYYYKSRITNQFRELKKIVTAPEYRLFEKYETVMINESLADATRCNQVIRRIQNGKSLDSKLYFL